MLDIILLETWARKNVDGTWVPVSCGCDYRHRRGWFVIPVRNGHRDGGPYPFLRAGNPGALFLAESFARDLLQEEPETGRGEIFRETNEPYHAPVDGRYGTCLRVAWPKIPVYESEV